MPATDQRALEHLRELGCRPAAPFFEQGPTAYIREVLAGLAGVESRLDDFGNVIAHYANGADASQPPIAFVAHMDHPGIGDARGGEVQLLERRQLLQVLHLGVAKRSCRDIDRDDISLLIEPGEPHRGERVAQSSPLMLNEQPDYTGERNSRAVERQPRQSR